MIGCSGFVDCRRSAPFGEPLSPVTVEMLVINIEFPMTRIRKHIMTDRMFPEALEQY